MDTLRLGVESVHFSDITGLYNTYINFFSVVAPYLGARYGHVGLTFKMSGKFSRKLLAIARTQQFSIGLTSGNTVKFGCIYRYVQCRTRTGAFGMHL